MHVESGSVAARIGSVVREERNRLGLTQDELALMAGVSTRVIHQIEAGKPTSRLDGVAAVLAALGLTLEPATASREALGTDDT